MAHPPTSIRGFRGVEASTVPFLLQGILALALALPGTGFALTRQKFNFVVGVDGDFKAAMAAATSASGSGKRFCIFFPDSQYDIGSLTGDANQMTTFSAPNVSFIGQSADNTVVYNKSINEGISITATLFFNNADNLYLQDLTLFNKAVYGNTAQYGVTGRHVVVQEQSDKVVYRNVKLKSTQDTYYTKGTRTYWEGGEIHGTTDFICGGGDVYFNKVLIWEMKVSDITASQSNSTWGYVFNGCTVDGTVSGTNLGRSWADARVVFLNTTMNKLPAAAGWGDPMNSVPKVFAEYKSVTSSGTAVDLSQRRKSYSLNGTTVNLNPVLTDAQAATYTVSAVLAGSDNWQPQTLSQQLAAPVLTQTGTTLGWDDNANALCWAIFRNGKYLSNVTTNGFDFTAYSSITRGDTFTVRAANGMGGLGPSSNRVVYGTTSILQNPGELGLDPRYDAANRTLRIASTRTGELDVRLYTLDGSLAFFRNVSTTADQSVEIPLGGLKAGTYLLRFGAAHATWTGRLAVF